MLRAIVRWFAVRPAVTLSLWLAAMVFGLVAYGSLLQRESFPAVESPVVVANGRYLVDDAELVDARVANLFGTAAIEFGGAETVQSLAFESSFAIVAEFPDDVRGEAAVDKMWESLFIASVPDSAEVWVDAVKDSKFLDLYDIVVAVHRDDDDESATLHDESIRLRQALASRPEIGTAKLVPVRSSGLNPITRERVVLESSFTLIAAHTSSGTVMRPSAAIGVSGRTGVDSTELRAAVDSVLAEISGRQLLGDGFAAEVALDLSPQVRRQLSSLQTNAITGLLAILVIALPLISWRSSLITGAFVLNVLAISFGVLWLLGMTLNTVSLLGIILALGLIVDDAVVMTNAIENANVDGRDVGEVVDQAVGQVGVATIAGTTTTILVFAPMLAISGVLGDFIRILPITVITVLLVSLLVSFLWVPAVAGVLVVSRGDHRGRLYQQVDRIAAAVAPSTVARPLVAGCLGVAMTAIGLFVFAPRVGFNIFPAQPDSTEIAVEIDFPPRTDIAEAKALAIEANQLAMDALGDHAVSSFASVGTTEFSQGQITLHPVGDRPPVPDLLRDTLRPIADSFQGARVSFSQISAGPPEATFPFRVQIFDEEPAVRLAAAQVVEAELEQAQLARGNDTRFRVVQTELEYTDAVARKDARLFSEVRARFDATDISSLLPAAQEFVEQRFDQARLASMGLRADALGFDFGAESDNDESFESMNTAFVVALVLILILLVILFRSASYWLLVLLAIPFSFFGVFGGLLVSNNPISFFAMLGVMGLIGIAVNNTILLTDFANVRRRNGADARTAISDAIVARFRPLVVTSLTTVVALLPLALRDPFWEALGLTIVFGLVSSTVLVLISFPSFYLGVEWLRSRWSPPWRQGPYAAVGEGRRA